MKNMIKIFENDEFGKVRTVIKDGEPWLVGKDVAEILGYSNTRDALSRHVDTEDKTTVVISDSGSNYKSKTTIINESGFYSLVLSSKMPRAKEFRRWALDRYTGRQADGGREGEAAAPGQHTA